MKDSSEINDLPTKADWSWWATNNGELYEVGPCDSREEAIAQAVEREFGLGEISPGVEGFRFEICEARQDPVLLSAWIDTDDMLERAEDSLADSDMLSAEFDEPPYFPATKDQHADLEARIKKACNDWQRDHNLFFQFRTFSVMRNQETVTVPMVASLYEGELVHA